MRLKQAITVALLALLVSCSAWNKEIVNLPDPAAPYATMVERGGFVDFEQSVSIQFLPGRPKIGDALDRSLAADQQRTPKRLDQLLALSLHRQSLQVEVIGFTDLHECSGKDCELLSKYRAELVYQLLIKKGLPETEVCGPYWRGSSMPLGLRNTEDSMQANRRVEVNLVPAKC